MNDAVLDQSARITRIPAPVASPGCCAICGKPDHPLGFAATDNFDFEFHGTIYFCADCVGDYARVFGFMSTDEYSNLIEVVKQQAEELQVLRESVVNLETILDAYAKLHHHTEPIGSIVANSSSPSEVIDDASDPTVEGAVSNGETGEGETSEPVSVERRDDVRDASSADDLFTELGLS